MNVGELWVANPIFPWLIIILGLWVASSTILQWRMWFRIINLKKQNKFLQDLIMGGIHGVSERLNEHKAATEKDISRNNNKNSRRKRGKKSYSPKIRSKPGSSRPETARAISEEATGENSGETVPITTTQEDDGKQEHRESETCESGQTSR